MHINKKWILFILGIFVVIIILIPKENGHIDYKVNSVNLTIYGLSREPKSYHLDNTQLISSLVKTINSLTLSENEIEAKGKFELPKGKSYELNFMGSSEKEFLLIENYCVYNQMVYKVNNYQRIIQDIEEYFGITDEGK